MFPTGLLVATRCCSTAARATASAAAAATLPIPSPATPSSAPTVSPAARVRYQAAHSRGAAPLFAPPSPAFAAFSSPVCDAQSTVAACRKSLRHAASSPKLRMQKGRPSPQKETPRKQLKGPPVAARILKKVGKDVAELKSAGGWTPRLLSVSVGDSDPSHLYIKNQRRVAEKHGMMVWAVCVCECV